MILTLSNLSVISLSFAFDEFSFFRYLFDDKISPLERLAEDIGPSVFENELIHFNHPDPELPENFMNVHHVREIITRNFPSLLTFTGIEDLAAKIRIIEKNNLILRKWFNFRISSTDTSPINSDSDN